MRVKTLTVFAAVIMFTGIASASIGFTETDQIPEQFSGGETFEVDTEFENDLGGSVPVFFELRVRDETGHEVEDPRAFYFDIAGSDVESGSEGESIVQCTSDFEEDFSEEVPSLYDRDICVFNNVSTGSHEATFEITSNVALESGEYDVSVDLMAPVATNPQEFFDTLFDDSSDVPKGEPYNFSTENVDVWVETELPEEIDEPVSLQETDGDERIPWFLRALVGVDELDKVNPEKSDAEFVRGVQVVAMDNIGYIDNLYSQEEDLTLYSGFFESLLFEENSEYEAEASGNITFDFEPSEVAAGRLSVYYYNTTSSEWESVDDVSEPSGQSITADVDHFSVYGLFEEDPPQSDSQSEQTSSGGDGVDLEPVAEAGSDMEVTVGETVQFNGSESRYEQISFLWEFGDGSTSTEESPTHVYNEVGTYSVELTVEQPDGDTDTDTVEVTVLEEEQGTDQGSSIDQDEGSEQNDQEESTTPPQNPNQGQQGQNGVLGQATGPTGQFVADNGSSLGLIGIVLVLVGTVYWKKEELAQIGSSVRAQFF